MDKKQLAQERKILRSRSRWLQKALFALSKAEDESERLADLKGENPSVRSVTINREACPIDTVTDALADSVRQWLEEERSAPWKEYAVGS
jgi:hypothetical protein